MRRLPWGLNLLLLLLTPALLGAVDLRPAILREAKRCAAAWQREDAAAIIAFSPPRVVQQMGGRAAVLAEINEQFARARSLGVERLEAQLGTPSIPRPIGRWLTALLPATAILHGPHVELTQETHVLALSADRGKHWSFVLLYEITQAELVSWFPEFRNKVIVPATPSPRLGFAP